MAASLGVSVVFAGCFTLLSEWIWGEEPSKHVYNGIHLTSLYISKEGSQFTKYHHAARTSRQIMHECAKKMIPETSG